MTYKPKTGLSAQSNILGTSIKMKDYPAMLAATPLGGHPASASGQASPQKSFQTQAQNLHQTQHQNPAQNQFPTMSIPSESDRPGNAPIGNALRTCAPTAGGSSLCLRMYSAPPSFLPAEVFSALCRIDSTNEVVYTEVVLTDLQVSQVCDRCDTPDKAIERALAAQGLILLELGQPEKVTVYKER